jgi:hypothetical protein
MSWNKIQSQIKNHKTMRETNSHLDINSIFDLTSFDRPCSFSLHSTHVSVHRRQMTTNSRSPYSNNKHPRPCPTSNHVDWGNLLRFSRLLEWNSWTARRFDLVCFYCLRTYSFMFFLAFWSLFARIWVFLYSIRSKDSKGN